MTMTSDLAAGTVVARSREPEGLRTMLMVSSIAHAAAVAALVTASWGLDSRHRAEEPLMQISFPAMPGPQHTKVSPAPPVRTPVAATKPAPPPTTAPELRAATSPVDTPSTSNEGGLAMSVEPGTNARSTSTDFCDPGYLGQMAASIHRNWQQDQNAAGRPIVRFVILRDGTLSEILLRQPSGFAGLDLAAIRAVTLTRAIPPLPACYPHPHYAMNLTFEYNR